MSFLRLSEGITEYDSLKWPENVPLTKNCGR